MENLKNYKSPKIELVKINIVDIISTSETRRCPCSHRCARFACSVSFPTALSAIFSPICFRCTSSGAFLESEARRYALQSVKPTTEFSITRTREREIPRL